MLYKYHVMNEKKLDPVMLSIRMVTHIAAEVLLLLLLLLVLLLVSAATNTNAHALCLGLRQY